MQLNMSFGSLWVPYMQSKIVWWIYDAHDTEYNYDDDDEDDALKNGECTAIV